MRSIKFTLPLVLVMILGFCSCSASSPPVTLTAARPLSSVQMKDFGYVNSIPKFENENVIGYQNSNGSTSLFIYAAPIEYGNLSINSLPDGSFKCFNQNLTGFFPMEWTSGTAIKLNKGNEYINIYPCVDQPFSAQKQNIMNAFGQEKEAIVYSDVFGEGMDFRCSLTSFGLNSEIILMSRPKQNTFRLRIKLPSLTPDSSSPDYILFRQGGESGSVQSIVYSPLAVDASQLWSYKNAVSIAEADPESNVYTLEYTIDQDFLQDQSTTYPVVLNQSIYFYIPKQPDTAAYSEYGDSRHYLSPYILLGDSSCKGEGWAYIRFETLRELSIPPENIVSARYIMPVLLDSKVNTTISAYAVKEDWCSVNTRWFTRPLYDVQPIAQTKLQDKGEYSLDITAFIKTILENKEQDSSEYSIENGFMIRSDTENSRVLLASGDNGLLSPVLEIVLSNHS